MNKEMLKNAIVYVAVVIFSVVFIAVGYNICKVAPPNSNGNEYFSAKVVSVGDVSVEYAVWSENPEEISAETVVFLAEIDDEEYEGKQIAVEQIIDHLYAYQRKLVEVGDKVVVAKNIDAETNVTTWQLVEYDRMGYIYILVGVFFLLILVIGRLKGVSTLLSLIFTTLAVFMIFIPSILKGYNIYVTTIIVSLFIILMSLLLINGPNKKTFCAILGNTCGVAIAGILAVVFDRMMRLTGVADEHYALLKYLDSGVEIDLNAVIWGGIVIGSLGAVMDVAMSISSSMNELSETMADKSFGNMIKSGMNIGRDAIGTMTNTLILAYIGGALSTVLLLAAYNSSLLYILNMESIIVEIIQGIIGSIGILIAVPFTTVLSAYIFNRTEKK